MGLFDELKKALTSSDAAALIPEDLDSLLHEELLALQPLAQIMGIVQAEGKTHEYSLRTAHPKAWFEGETAGGTNKKSTYARKTVQLKIQRIWGSVTGFTQAVTEQFIDALEAELIGSVEGMANAMEYGIMWGAADDVGFTGDAYQYSGIIPRVFAYAPTNVVDAGGDKITLTDLDALLAKVARHRQTRLDPRLFIMGLEMKQVVDGLQSKVQIPLTTTELADGRIVMSSYGRTPILESDYIVPASVTTSPTPSAAAGSGGSLPNDSYDYRFASVTYFGEQVGGTAEGGITLSGGEGAVDLTWTADSEALLYMIFRQDGGSGDFYLIDIIPALTYDADGEVNGSVEAYTDDGSQSSITQVKPLESGEEQILIYNTTPGRGAAFVGMVDDMGNQIDSLVNFVELARVKDSYDYFLKSYHALRLVHPNLASVLRHVKRA